MKVRRRTMSEKANETFDDTVGSTGRADTSSVRDPLDSTVELISLTVPQGVDRRTFLMRSAVVGATAIITGRSIAAQEKTQRATAPAPNLDPSLDVVKKGQGPVMTT